MAHGPEVVRDNMGHANIDVTQNVYGKSWWEERVEAVTRAVDAISVASQNSEEDQANRTAQAIAAFRNEDRVPLWMRQQESKFSNCWVTALSIARCK